MPVRQCSLGCCNQQLLITSINKNEERKAKSKNTTGLRISLPRPLHHFVSTSLQQGLYLYKLSHVAMVTLAVTASSTFPLAPSTTSGQQHFSPAGRTGVLEKPSHACSLWFRQSLVPISEQVLGQLKAATVCHSWLFARTLQVMNMGLLWAAARTCPVLAKWGACFWACLWSSSSLVPCWGVVVTKGW